MLCFIKYSRQTNILQIQNNCGWQGLVLLIERVSLLWEALANKVPGAYRKKQMYTNDVQVKVMRANIVNDCEIKIQE